PGSDGINGMPQADEETFEVVLAGFVDLASLDMDVVDQDFFLSDKLIQVETERTDVPGQILGRLFKSQEDAGFPELGGPAHEEFGGEQSLAASGAAAHQRRAAARQTAAGDFIKAGNAGWRLREGSILWGILCSGFAHPFLRESHPSIEY